MAQTMPPRPAVTPAPQVPDCPKRQRSIPRSTVVEMGGSAVAAIALVWVLFAVAGITGPLGFGFCSLVGFFVIYGILCWRQYGALALKDRLATVAIWSGALIAFVPLLGVILYVIYKGLPVVWAGFPGFFYKSFTGYTANAPVTAVGAGAAVIGTVEQVGLATAFTVPLGVLTATYLVNNRNTFSRLVGSVVDAMTGAPAIIAGLFIYLLWVQPQKESGQTGFAAALSLSVMMLPIVTRASQEVITIVPGSLKEAALALGSPQWRSILRVTLPTARVGLVTAVILGIARVAGETAPVLFTAGGSASYNWNPFSGRQDDLPLRVYEMIFQPGANATRAAWGVAFVLVLVVLLLFTLARLIGSKSPGPSRLTLPWRVTRQPQGELEP
jgi:phosphate transport system permease protein